MDLGMYRSMLNAIESIRKHVEADHYGAWLFFDGYDEAVCAMCGLLHFVEENKDYIPYLKEWKIELDYLNGCESNQGKYELHIFNHNHKEKLITKALSDISDSQAES